MLVRFPKLRDGDRGYCVVERDDGVRYRVEEGVARGGVPHDLVHLVVERETGDRSGFWGAVADGAVFGSMHHVHGRRPPHARMRSRAAIARRGDRALTRAELLAGLVEEIVDRRLDDETGIRHATREALATQDDADVDPGVLLAAARALERVRAEWASLRVGEELTVDWPAPRR